MKGKGKMLLDKKMKGRGWKGEYVDYSALKLSEKKDRLREGEREKKRKGKKKQSHPFKIKKIRSSFILRTFKDIYSFIIFGFIRHKANLSQKKSEF